MPLAWHFIAYGRGGAGNDEDPEVTQKDPADPEPRWRNMAEKERSNKKFRSSSYAVVAGPDAGLGAEPCVRSCSQDVDPGDSDASDTMEAEEEGSIRVIRCSCMMSRPDWQAMSSFAGVPSWPIGGGVFCVHCITHRHPAWSNTDVSVRRSCTEYTRTQFLNYKVSGNPIISWRVGPSGSSSSGGGTTRHQPSEDVSVMSVHALGPHAIRGRRGSCGKRLRSPAGVFCVGCDMPVHSTGSVDCLCNHCLDVLRGVSGLCPDIQYGDVSALPAETMASTRLLLLLLLLLWHLLLLMLLRGTFRF
jgi:hypothetical protein